MFGSCRRRYRLAQFSILYFLFPLDSAPCQHVLRCYYCNKGIRRINNYFSITSCVLRYYSACDAEGHDIKAKRCFAQLLYKCLEDLCILHNSQQCRRRKTNCTLYRKVMETIFLYFMVDGINCKIKYFSINALTRSYHFSFVNVQTHIIRETPQ